MGTTVKKVKYMPDGSIVALENIDKGELLAWSNVNYNVSPSGLRWEVSANNNCPVCLDGLLKWGYIDGVFKGAQCDVCGRFFRMQEVIFLYLCDSNGNITKKPR